MKGSKLTNDLGQASQCHGDHEGPGLPFQALDKLDDTACCKDDEEEDIGTEIGTVCVNGCFDRAEFGHFGAVIILAGHCCSGKAEQSRSGRIEE